MAGFHLTSALLFSTLLTSISALPFTPFTLPSITTGTGSSKRDPFTPFTPSIAVGSTPPSKREPFTPFTLPSVSTGSKSSSKRDPFTPFTPSIAVGGTPQSKREPFTPFTIPSISSDTTTPKREPFTPFTIPSISTDTTTPKRAAACFVVGSTTLPAEVADTVTAIQDVVTCDTSKKTIGTVPDTISGGVSFSSINFASSSLTPLNFALSNFATATPLASSNLTTFQNQLNVYLATEAGVRSTGGSLAIKDPKFFLSFQIARIKTAQGAAITDAGQTVTHLLGKVINNAGSEDQATKDKVTALSTVLS